MSTVFNLLQMGRQSSNGWADLFFVFECRNLPSKPPDKTSNTTALFSRKVMPIRTIWLVHSRWWRKIYFAVRPVIKLQFIYTMWRRVRITVFVLLWVIHKGPSTLSSKLSIDESWHESEKLEDVLFRGRGEQRTRPSVCAIKKPKLQQSLYKRHYTSDFTELFRSSNFVGAVPSRSSIFSGLRGCWLFQPNPWVVLYWTCVLLLRVLEGYSRYRISLGLQVKFWFGLSARVATFESRFVFIFCKRLHFLNLKDEIHRPALASDYNLITKKWNGQNYTWASYYILPNNKFHFAIKQSWRVSH